MLRACASRSRSSRSGQRRNAANERCEPGTPGVVSVGGAFPHALWRTRTLATQGENREKDRVRTSGPAFAHPRGWPLPRHQLCTRVVGRSNRRFTRWCKTTLRRFTRPLTGARCRSGCRTLSARSSKDFWTAVCYAAVSRMSNASTVMRSGSWPLVVEVVAFARRVSDARWRLVR